MDTKNNGKEDKPEQREPADATELFLRAYANASEHFSQVFLVVSNNGNIMWKSSDKTWAVGAIVRFRDMCSEADHIATRESSQNTQEGGDDDE